LGGKTQLKKFVTKTNKTNNLPVPLSKNRFEGIVARILICWYECRSNNSVEKKTESEIIKQG
jgi:hypothetical protein